MTAPFLISWNLTRRCNLACGHCYLSAHHRDSAQTGELSTAEAREVITQITDLAPGSMVVLTGGEPMLRSDLPEIVSACVAAGLMPVIGTNGTLLDECAARMLRDAGVAGVGISVDSANPDFHDRLRGYAGSWTAAISGIAAARRTGLAVLMQTTMFEDNRREIDAIADLAADLQAIALNFFFLVCTGRGVTQTDLDNATYAATVREILRLQSERPGVMIRARCAPYVRRELGLKAGDSAGTFADFSSSCLAGKSYLRITPEGKVTPCPYIPGVAGSLRREGLRSIFEQSAMFRRLRDERPGGKCGDCDFAVSCGGCRARALAVRGDLMAEDPKCDYVRPPDRHPETLPAETRVLGCEQELAWADDAWAMLERIPSFVRARVKERTEARARSAGVSLVTLEFMRAHRPPAAFGCG
ncbi:radical SAM protein [Bradyrhizobium sp.]|uniref:radical SAM protein n=1 Tax=Bradyrhizobium sp. TaxID=376 RepID=UPI0040384E8F